ncbi:cytochrome P450 [Bipolaris maydis]|nr:cytochrome P450 [Bipolaris maydis]
MLTVLYTLCCCLLPKPITGIPYNKEAIWSLLGDKESPGNIFGWIIHQSRRHGPIFQLWLGPCQKPTVIITDFREAQDILMRRKELEGASVFGSVLGGEARSFHITMSTGPRWKARRRLLQDLMAPKSLHKVAIPNIYRSATLLLDLWKNKAEAVHFPIATVHPALDAVLHTIDNVQLVAATGFPRLAWLIFELLPHIRRRRKVRDELIVNQVLHALDRFNTLSKQHDDDTHVSNYSLATRCTYIIGFVVAGHDKTSTTMRWIFKFISDNPDVQKKLFESLRSFHAAAVTEDHLPTHSEICNASIPYLDAVVEESLPLSHTAIFQDRECTEDAIILGHYIPKGPSFTEPGLDIEESIRSPTCQAAAQEYGFRAWDEKGMDEFYPERWLMLDDNGRAEFNSVVGPTLPFSLGLRGCFGRKLACLELKMLTTLLVWNFELQCSPEGLSSYESLEGLTRKPS